MDITLYKQKIAIIAKIAFTLSNPLFKCVVYKNTNQQKNLYFVKYFLANLFYKYGTKHVNKLSNMYLTEDYPEKIIFNNVYREAIHHFNILFYSYAYDKFIRHQSLIDKLTVELNDIVDDTLTNDIVTKIKDNTDKFNDIVLLIQTKFNELLQFHDIV